MRLAVIFLAFLGATSPAMAAEPVTACSRVEAGGVRTLCHEIVVPASTEVVWALWATSPGLSSWAAPLVGIDLRVGGLWEASYRPGARLGDDANIRNRVLAYVPEQMLTIAVDRAPPGFAHADLVRTLRTVIELEPAGANATRVRVTMTGYGAGEGYDALYREFERGNAWTLGKLHRAHCVRACRLGRARGCACESRRDRRRLMSAREKIIKAAMELFWLKGYNSTSIADLLSRTQLNSGSLYHVFPSKQDVLIGVLEAYRDGIEEMLLGPAWEGVDDPIEKIFALLGFYRILIVDTRVRLWLPDRLAGA